MQGARFDGDELKGRLDGMGKQFTDICYMVRQEIQAKVAQELLEVKRIYAEN